MKEASLPSPGVGSKSMHLRRIAANAISALEMIAPKYANGSHPGAEDLVAFFDACSAAAAETGKSDTTLTFGTAGDATEVEVGATLATTLDKGGSTGAATYTSSDTEVATVNSSGVITGVAEGTVSITVSVAATDDNRAATAFVDVEVIAAA